MSESTQRQGAQQPGKTWVAKFLKDGSVFFRVAKVCLLVFLGCVQLQGCALGDRSTFLIGQGNMF